MAAKRKVCGSETADNPCGLVATEKQALRFARSIMPADLRRAGFVASIFSGDRGWRINYSAGKPA